MPADRVPGIERLLNQPAAASSLPCEFAPRNPERNFSLGFDVPYRVRFPSGAFHDIQKSLTVFLRVAPVGNENQIEYIESRYDLSLVPQTGGPIEVAGRFPLATGIHHVSAVAVDQTGHICRDDWPVEIPALPRKKDGAHLQPIGRLTVILDAAPLDWHRSAMNPTDEAALIGMLRGLLAQVPARSVRMIAFNMDLETEPYRSDGRQPVDVEAVSQALASVRFHTVDYTALRGFKGPVPFLASLLARELREPQQADTVVFLGPLVRSGQEFPKSAVPARSGRQPRFFYVQYREPEVWDNGPPEYDTMPTKRPAGPPPPATVRDSIALAMERLHGRTLIFGSPAEFDHAVDRIRRELMTK